MVCATARQREGIVFVVTAFAMPTVQIFQAQHIVGGLCGGWGRECGPGSGGRDVLPKASHAERERQAGKQKHGRKQTHQQVVREQRVEIAIQAT